MSTKAAHYLEALDQARCNAKWADVPELVRKVRKHAPEKSCIALTAETEHAVAQATTAPARPASSATHSITPEAEAELSDRIPRLLEAVEREAGHPQDTFQAQVCAGWLYWLTADYTQSLSSLPKLAGAQFESLDSLLESTTIAALKASYLKANILTRQNENAEALDAFQAGLPFLDKVWSGQPISSQLRSWSELYLTEFCTLSGRLLRNNEVSLGAADSLTCFRSWARYWEAVSGLRTGGYGFKSSVPRRAVWQEYYTALSRVLEDDMPIPLGYNVNIVDGMSPRSRLRVELKSVELSYQALLFAESTFPAADESRPEVEAFVHLVVKNWSILCGRGWREQDLGQGGRSSISRGVLDALYGAAAKTYHSPAILRCLFRVHLSVAEFELAFKAFDAYMEIVKKARARVEKTGQADDTLDDDGTVLETMAQCVMALCRYGHRKSAEKARRVGAELEDWLAKLPQPKSTDAATPSITEDIGQQKLLQAPVPPHVIALSWQAIGLSHAQWSRITHEAASRTEIQSKAMRCLRRSLANDLGRSKDVKGFFSLGLLLAERRELPTAIELVKSALISNRTQEDEEYDLLQGAYHHERSLIPLWNLLALLLSARQDYLLAARACEGALEQFKDPAVLFGSADPTTGGSGPQQENSPNGEAVHIRGLVDEMDDAERESILQVKMTQLALIEVLEGPNVAVNASYELLALFHRLFGTVSTTPSIKVDRSEDPPPQTAGGRSVRTALFGTRSDRSRPPTRETSGATAARPTTAQTVVSTAPTIQVTEVNGYRGARSRQRDSGHGQRSVSGRRNSLKKRDRSAGRRRASSVGAPPVPPTVVDGETYFTPAVERTENDLLSYSSKMQSPSSAASFSRGPVLRSANSQLSTNTKSTEQSDISVDGTYASTNVLPVIQFPQEKERAQRTTILIKVWLMIAGFYRRAGMYDDCKKAIVEAQKLVQGLEAETALESSGSGGGKYGNWAEQKSIDELWGDVWTEMGDLSQAAGSAYVARTQYESALAHYPDHPAATVGLSSILLDIYSEKLRPIPAIPPLDVELSVFGLGTQDQAPIPSKGVSKALPSRPLGLGGSNIGKASNSRESSLPKTDDQPVAPYKATRLPLVDRLAARDRAFALLSGLTRLGSGWNYSDAWFALARAHEESEQPEKAKEALWWCVELEEAMAVRDWRCLGGGGYVI
ncbi:hypothetical protein S40293_01905 [Stachybotrys chartarum IBT 40293]|nr:hypothetical protein S40293_01905 [Stachybotrys chartarum IBT 40293]